MKKFGIIALLALSSCASAPNGELFKSETLPEIESAQAQIVIYRPAQFSMPRDAEININNEIACNMPPKSFFVENVPSGNIKISSGLWDFHEDTVLNLKTKSKKTHYLEMKHAGGDGYGVLGAVLSNNHSEQRGPFRIREVFESEALPKLSKLKQSCQ